MDAVTHYNNPAKLVECSMNLGEPMPGLDVRSMPEIEKMAGRGW